MLLVGPGDPQARPGIRNIRMLVAGLAFPVLVILQFLQGGLPAIGRIEWIDAIQPESGLAWTADLHDAALDDDTHHLESTLYEWLPNRDSSSEDWLCRFAGPGLASSFDNFCAGHWRALGPGHQIHESIRQEGGGRFSVWHGTLYFSTPEGGDPRRAGRSFALLLPWTIQPDWQGIVIAVALFGSMVVLACDLLYRHRRIYLIALAFLACATAGMAGRTIAMLGWGGGLLIILQILPQDRSPHRGLPAAIWVAAGFLVAEAALSYVLPGLGLVPNLQIMGLQKYVVQLETDRPVLLLVGSSLTQYGIDESALQTALEAAGHPVTVARLGFGGLSVPERLYYLRSYLAQAKHRPAAVLFETSVYYELQPLRQLEQNRFTEREIAAMDAGNFRLSLDWVFGPESAPSSRLRLVADLAGHFAMHLLHIGFLPNSVRSTELAPRSYAGSPPKTQHFPDAEIAADLAEGQSDQALSLPLPDGASIPAAIPSRWMRGVIDEQAALLKAAGITRLGFFGPPSRFPDEPIYVRQFCRAMTAYPCISADDPALIAALGHDEDWLDQTHLQGPGRQLYTEWLAARLVASGALP